MLAAGGRAACVQRTRWCRSGSSSSSSSSRGGATSRIARQHHRQQRRPIVLVQASDDDQNAPQEPEQVAAGPVIFDDAREQQREQQYPSLLSQAAALDAQQQPEPANVVVPPLGSIDRSSIEAFLRPDPEELPDDLEMPIWDHLEELRERVLVGLLAAGVAIGGCFCFSKELVLFLEAPVADAGVRFLQLSPGEFFFTTFKVAGYSGLLLSAPTVLYEIIAYVVPGLTKSERRFLAPIVFGSSILFYVGLVFSYEILTPAALNFFVSYAEGAVESLWSIDQYFQFVLVLMLSTGLSFQVPIIQVMLGQLGIVSSTQMFSLWRYVVVGSTVAAAVLTPSTDPFTQALLAIPLVGLYMGGAAVVRLLEGQRSRDGAAPA